MELTATAFIGFVLSVFYFALSTATLAQANKATPKDVPNIVFGSFFIAFAVAIAIYTTRAIFSV